MTKLLIVDDEEFTVDMLSTFLQINGFETVGAFNGEDGLVLTQVERPEIIILDLMLPDIEGYEVCRRIRTFPDGANLPVLVLSARAETTAKDRAFAAGADAYLTKPVQFPQLLSELNRLIAAKTQPATPAAQPPAQPSTPQTPQATQQVSPTPPAPAPAQTTSPTQPAPQAGTVAPVTPPMPTQPSAQPPVPTSTTPAAPMPSVPPFGPAVVPPNPVPSPTAQPEPKTPPAGQDQHPNKS